MRFWNFARDKFRPVEKLDHMRQPMDPDAFLDEFGRIWYADTPHLRHLLYTQDPADHKTIPAEFWHPNLRKQRDREYVADQKRQIDDERADQRARQPELVL